ncbi:MAG: ATPase, T2SS/T4P/T4SS family [Actinomycetota bacterium]
MLHDELGSLATHFASPHITEVMVNNETSVFIEDHTGMHYVGELHPGELHAIVERILLPLGKRLDRVSPIVDARLRDGSRLCAVIPPVSPHGMCVSIRRFTQETLTLQHFAEEPVINLLLQAVRNRCNIVVSGKAGSGKTSLLNVLCSHMNSTERVVTIEDVRELALTLPNAVQLETRPNTPEGLAGINMTDLVRTSLRLRPDRIIVGEIRDAEVVDMLSALNTGHSGSLSTCHAHSASQASQRIESLMLQHCPQWTREIIRDHMSSAIDLVVHVSRGSTGRRYISEIVEIPTPFSGHVRHLFNGGEVLAGTRTRARVE